MRKLPIVVICALAILLTPAPASAEPTMPAVAAAIRRCEHGGSYDRSSNRSHFGAYQFDRGTWASNGGNPAHWGNASPEEQDAVFLTTFSRRGTSPWNSSRACWAGHRRGQNRGSIARRHRRHRR